MTNQDRAYELMTIKADLLEVSLGERTNTETVKEGRINFQYKVWFCTEEQKVTIKTIKVNLKG
jgi:hypothetical protein